MMPKNDAKKPVSDSQQRSQKLQKQQDDNSSPGITNQPGGPADSSSSPGAENTPDMPPTNPEPGAAGPGLESSGNYATGNPLADDLEGAVLNVRSQLSRVVQNLGIMPHLPQADKDELVRLVKKLKQQLEQVLPERTGEAEKVARRVEVLITELAEDQPDVEMVKTMGKTLKRAAENLGEPAALATTSQIIAYALRLAR
jgi:hypothetical protein